MSVSVEIGDFLEFAFKVGGKDALADGAFDFIDGPEATTCQLFARWRNGAIVNGFVHIYQLALPFALKHIVA